MKRLPLMLMALALSLATAAPALSQPLEGGPPVASGTLKVDLKGQTTQALSLPRGKSAIIELPIDVRDVHVTNATIADVALPYARRIYIMGVTSGQTDAVFFDGAGRRILSLNIRVEQDLGGLAETIARVAPTARVQAEAVNDRVILTGQVANASDADRIVRVASSYTQGADKVLNMMTLGGKDQVLLKVRIVEMNRNIIKQFGISTEFLMKEAGAPQLFFQNIANFPVNGTVQGGLNIGGVKTTGPNDLNVTSGALQAFERVGMIRTLAEPNLTAVSGEAAKFLAGGEFPVPSAIDKSGQVTVTFKPFGVGLGFTPEVLSEGRIALKIATEVSDLSPTGAFSLGGGTPGVPTLAIPAITVRRAETSVELSSGSQLMIAGLLRDDTRQNIDGVPGLKDIAVLGSLFRSRDYQSGQTELVVLVTAYIVDPVAAGKMQSPIDGLEVASDAGAILMGRLNNAYKVSPPAGRTFQGPFGHVIE
jgi:pilus assembly protein CpaC